MSQRLYQHIWPHIRLQHPLSTGLQLALLGNGAGSSTAFDSSPFGRHGTLTNMDPPTDWQPDATLGRHRLDFDGGNDWVNEGNILGTATSISVAAFVRFASISSFQTIAAKRDGIGTANWAFRKGQDGGGTNGADTELTFYHYAADGWKIYHTSDAALVVATWYFVAVSYDGIGDPKIYVNGRLCAGAWAAGYSGPVAMVANSANTSIGGLNNGTNEMLSGSLADLCAWDYVLPSELFSPKIWLDPMLGGWLYDPARRVIPWVSSAAAGGPFPHFLRRRHLGGMLAC